MGAVTETEGPPLRLRLTHATTQQASDGPGQPAGAVTSYLMLHSLLLHVAAATHTAVQCRAHPLAQPPTALACLPPLAQTSRPGRWCCCAPTTACTCSPPACDPSSPSSTARWLALGEMQSCNQWMGAPSPQAACLCDHISLPGTSRGACGVPTLQPSFCKLLCTSSLVPGGRLHPSCFLSRLLRFSFPQPYLRWATTSCCGCSPRHAARLPWPPLSSSSPGEAEKQSRIDFSSCARASRE